MIKKNILKLIFSSWLNIVFLMVAQTFLSLVADDLQLPISTLKRFNKAQGALKAVLQLVGIYNMRVCQPVLIGMALQGRHHNQCCSRTIIATDQSRCCDVIA